MSSAVKPANPVKSSFGKREANRGLDCHGFIALIFSTSEVE
jgi:hypothetical protein